MAIFDFVLLLIFDYLFVNVNREYYYESIIWKFLKNFISLYILDIRNLTTRSGEAEKAQG